MIFSNNSMKRIKFLVSIIGVGLFSLSLSSCASNKAKNCTLYGATRQNDSGEIVATFKKGQKKNNTTIEMFGSNADKSSGLVFLYNRGILFNKTNTGSIKQMIINISDECFESAKVFHGQSPLPVEKSQSLALGENIISFTEENKGFFVIQNQGADFSIDSISYTYKNEVVDSEREELPTIHINTENRKSVTSLTKYVSCQIVTDEYPDGLTSEIKVRGNSTAHLKKKPYRIKLDKKASLFGYQKSKNYVLLADYMDASKMHNYAALKFSKLVRDLDEFTPNPMHVNVYLNDNYRGVYLMCEHIDEKAEHMNLAQDELWSLDFNDINFYLDRDASSQYEEGAEEGQTYLEIKVENYQMESYFFEMKYPEKDDFIEEKEDGTELFHKNEWNAYVSNLRNYLNNVCNAFANYYASSSNFSQIDELVDVNSLAEFGVVDQLLCEADHIYKSFKVFKRGEKLEFGPCWDYDACSLGFPYADGYTEDPFEHDATQIDYIFELWAQTLYNDEVNGKPLYQSIWDSLSEEVLNEYVSDLYQEIDDISYDLLTDCEKWVDKKYYVVFDNISFVAYYFTNKINYLKNGRP